MNFRKIGLVIFLVAAVLLFILNRKPPALLTQNSFSLTPIGHTGYSLQSVLVLYNPNLLSSTIKNISEKYYISGQEAATLNIEFDRGIPGLKETALPVNVRFSKNVLPLFSNYDSTAAARQVDITVTGEITYENIIGGGKFNFSKTDSLFIPANK